MDKLTIDLDDVLDKMLEYEWTSKDWRNDWTNSIMDALTELYEVEEKLHKIIKSRGWAEVDDDSYK